MKSEALLRCFPPAAVSVRSMGRDRRSEGDPRSGRVLRLRVRHCHHAAASAPVRVPRLSSRTGYVTLCCCCCVHHVRGCDIRVSLTSARSPVWRRGEGHDMLFAGIHNAWDTVTYHVFRQEGRTHYRARRRGALSSSRLHVDGVWRRRGRDRFAVDGDGRDERETAARVHGIVD